MLAETKTHNPFHLAREHGRREAFGYITRDNIESLLLWVQDLLFKDGEPRRYTMVCAYEYARWRPEVRTGQEAEELKLLQGDWGSSILILDTYGLWMLDAQRGTELRNAEYVVVSDSHLQVSLRTPEGRLAWLHVQLEDES